MDRIFHYTNLNALELILSNSTIRFNSLKNMDDKLEGFSLDFENMAQYYYVSSWTLDKYENIPLWYMYTDKMRGVRIEADSDFLELIQDEKSNNISNLINTDLLAFSIVYGKNDSFLTPVQYKDSFDSCIEGIRGLINSNFFDIGRIKPKAWEFQKEVRFRLYGINKKSLTNFGDTLFQNFCNAIINSIQNDIDYVDIKFDINKLNNANFMLGPASTDEDCKILKKIISEYIPKHTGKIQKSKLQIRFKPS